MVGVAVDSYGTVWFIEGADGERVPVDVEHEFGDDWIGHNANDAVR